MKRFNNNFAKFITASLFGIAMVVVSAASSAQANDFPRSEYIELGQVASFNCLSESKRTLVSVVKMDDGGYWVYVVQDRKRVLVNKVVELMVLESFPAQYEYGEDERLLSLGQGWNGGEDFGKIDAFTHVEGSVRYMKDGKKYNVTVTCPGFAI